MIYGRWDAREKTPEALAGRFRRLMSAITALHPAFDGWLWGSMDGDMETFASANRDLAAAISKNYFRDDWDEKYPKGGYRAAVVNQIERGPTAVVVGASAGDFSVGRGGNHISLKTDFRVAPDPSIVAYEVFRPAILALSETYDVDFCAAYPIDLMALWRRGQRYRLAWMSYVKPEWASLITPPASAIVEHRPNGGLFMAATDETFRTQSPDHLAVAQDIVAALAPLEAMPDGWEQVRAWERAQGRTA
jgi:hypothetical protein